jgi:D-lyxose ketol-isomerase
MKRSDINQLISQAESFFERMQFRLPAWAHWNPGDWKSKKSICAEIVSNGLGWDITDFGVNDFYRKGLLLFTIRNGNPVTDKKPYAEKIMIVREKQLTPMHFHFSKMEDIINRGGGRLVIRLYGSTEEGHFSERAVQVAIDGMLTTVSPGGSVCLAPGESICLEPGVYHEFFTEPGSGDVLVGEVSAVNDDIHDNRFYEDIGRFPTILEDKTPYRLLVQDYKQYLA